MKSSIGPQQRRVIDCLLKGYDNADTARELGMAQRTVKAHLARLYLRFNIEGGIKRVKLASILYHRRQEWETSTEAVIATPETAALSNTLPKVLPTNRLRCISELRTMS